MKRNNAQQLSYCLLFVDKYRIGKNIEELKEEEATTNEAETSLCLK